MANTICFEQNTFLLSILMLVLLSLFFAFKNGLEIGIESMEEPPKPVVKETKEVTETTETAVVPTPELENGPAPVPLSEEVPTDPFLDRDYRHVYDTLTPPRRRLPRHVYPNHPLVLATDIHTRGYPDNYHYIGNLVRKTDELIVKLFGRQTYPGSNRYEYYGAFTDKHGGETKIQIHTRNESELFDGDEIFIDIFDNSLGKFKLYMNDLDRPRYNPYLFY